MTKLFHLGLSFLKNSKMLTFSAFFSIFVSCFLGVGLFQLASNIDHSVRITVMEQVDEQVELYGDSGLDLSAMVNELMEDYRGMHRFLTILYALIFGISCLFIICIFREFLKKYVREMAIIRTFGGKTGQVNLMFLFMSVTVSFFACLAAGITAAVADGFLLNYLNQEYAFFRGRMIMDWPVFFGMLFFTFFLLNLLLMIFFSLSQYGLPMQIFHQTETGLRRRKDGLRFLFLRKVMGTDGYLAWKLLLPKWKQNLFIILLIICMTAFSYVGESFMTLLVMNSRAYLEDLLKGADGYGRIADGYGRIMEGLDAGPIEPQKVDRIRERCQGEQVECSYMHGCYDGQLEGVWAFCTTDLKDFRERFVKDSYQEISSVPLGEQMLVGKILAEEEGYHLGERVRLESKYLKEEKEYTIVGILDWSPYNPVQKEYQILVDRENFIEPRTGEKNDGNGGDVFFWFYGDSDAIQNIFRDLKREGWDFTGYISEEVWADTEKQIRQENILSKIVVWGLMLVIAIGWLNSARGILVSRKRDYHVLRLMGTGQKRMQKICYLQIGSYLLTGIVLGSILGFALSNELWKKELYYGINKLNMHWESVVEIFLLFVLVSLFLRGTVREVSE